MFNIDRQIVLAIAVSAVTALVVGCGDGGSKKLPARKTIPPNTQKIDPKTGKPIADPSKIDPKTGKPYDPKDIPVQKDDPKLETLRQFDESLRVGTARLRDELPAGEYTLQSVTVTLNVLMTGPTASARAYNEFVGVSSGNTFVLKESGKKDSVGVLPTFNDSVRKMDLPIFFTAALTGGKFTASQVSPSTFTSLATTPAPAGLLVLSINDNKLIPSSNERISMLNLLDGSAGSDKGYSSKDDKNQGIMLRALKVDETTYRIVVDFEEQKKSNLGTDNTNFNRAIFFTYKVKLATPPVEKPAATTTTDATTTDTATTPAAPNAATDTAPAQPAPSANQ